MKAIGIVTDSHSGISQEEAARLGIMVLPMPFYFDEECYYEDVTLSREEYFEKMKQGRKVSTSQPAPADVMRLWDKALLAFQQILYMPISSGLSGSYSAAYAMAQEEEYQGRVHVIDHGRVSTPLHRYVLDALALVEEGYSACEIKEILEKYRENMVIYIGVETLEYLKQGGRITPATALFGTMLHIKPVLKLGVGTLDTFQKCRGFARARKTMLEAMQHDIDTIFREPYEKGELYLLAASSASEEVTAEWVAEIKEAFPDMDVLCDKLSLGVSCHVGYGGLGVGCSCRPPRGR